MAKQSGRRDSARSHPLRIAAYVLLIGGIALVATALTSKGTRIEAASDGLLLIGWPLLILGVVLKGLHWMSSYTAAHEGSWDHHVDHPSEGGSEGLVGSRRRDKRMRLLDGSDEPSDLGLSVPAVEGAPISRPSPAHDRAASQATDQGSVLLAASASTVAAAARPAGAGKPLFEPEPVPELEPEEPSYSYDGGRSDPGPDTVIEEFVGYEGQDRMLAVRDATPPPPPPRELSWPSPPYAPTQASPVGDDEFLGKLMDDVMSKLKTLERAPDPPAPAAAAADAAPVMTGGNGKDMGSHAQAPVARAPLSASPPQVPLVWSPHMLHSADHWRFAALVEKLYQQAGFATQLQAGQTMRGVVVLWLFSRHRPGMPASVVSCVHAPGGLLPPEEIVAVADLVKGRDLPRGQLATTGQVDDTGRQLAAAHSVHLIDTDRLLQLIAQRSPEQQRVLADRLA